MLESVNVVFVGTKISKFLVNGEVRLAFPTGAEKPSNPLGAFRFTIKNFEGLEQVAPNSTFVNPVGPGEFECRDTLFAALQSSPGG